MQFMSLFKSIAALLAAGALSLLAGCGGGGGASSTGTLNVSLTDAPSCGYDEVNITVDHVEISNDDGATWIQIPVDAGLEKFNLLDYTNGALKTIGSAPLPAGTYNQVRLVLKDNEDTPLANTLVLTSDAGKTEIPLKTPSAQQSGLKMVIIGSLTVQAGTEADLVLDFNACKSIVVAGSSDKYILKPVVKAVAMVVSGSVTGTTMAGSQVYAQLDGQILNGTVADATTGEFTLFPIEHSLTGGKVDVVVVPQPPTSGTAGYGVAIIQDVPVGALTQVGTITPQEATIRTVSGTVKAGSSPVAANLEAKQTVTSNGRTYEIAATATTTGDYSLSLAAEGPWVGVYSTTQPIGLSVETTNAGKYSVTATDAEGASKTVSVTVTSSTDATADINLTP